MAKKNQSEELSFLEEYYKFYSKNKGGNMASFVVVAQKTLVETGQISEEVLKNFQATYYLQEQLENKQKEVDALKKEINILKSQMNVRPVLTDDGCGRGFRSSSSPC